MIVRSEASPPRLLTDVDRAQAARVGRSAGAARPSRAVRQHPGSNNCVEGGLGLPVPLLKRWAAGPPRSRMTPLRTPSAVWPMLGLSEGPCGRSPPSTDFQLSCSGHTLPHPQSCGKDWRVQVRNIYLILIGLSALVPSITFAEDSPTARGWAIGCYNRVCLAVDGAGHSKHLDLNNNKNVFAGPDFKGEPPFAISCENTGYCAIVDAKGKVWKAGLRAPSHVEQGPQL